jgi:hypothetical protein
MFTKIDDESRVKISFSNRFYNKTITLMGKLQEKLECCRTNVNDEQLQIQQQAN